MEKVISSYETMFIVSVTGGEEATAAVVAKFKALIEANGTIGEWNEWGKRKLAYPINDMTEGYYILVTFKSEPNFIAELQRLFNINENIMRSLVIKV